MNIVNKTDIDLAQVEKSLKNFYPFAKKYLGFDQDADFEFVSDPENAKKTLGYTAYYNPENFQVTVYCDDRHPKDLLRSIAHELVHHTQNIKGEFKKAIATEAGYAQNDPHLREMEREAYEKGNLCFRDWEDKTKQGLLESKKTSYHDRMSFRDRHQAQLGRLLMESWGFVRLVEASDEPPREISGDANETMDQSMLAYLESQDPSDLELAKRTFEEYIVPVLTGFGLEYKGFRSPDAMVKTETNALFRAIEPEAKNIKVAHIQIELDPLEGLYETIIDSDTFEYENKWDDMRSVIEHLQNILGVQVDSAPEPIDKGLNLQKGEVREMKNQTGKYTRKLTREQITKIVTESLAGKSQVVAKKKLGEMVQKVLHLMTEQEDKFFVTVGEGKPPKGKIGNEYKKSTKVTGKPAGSLAEGANPFAETEEVDERRGVQRRGIRAEQDDKLFNKATGQPAGSLVQEEEEVDEQDDKLFNKATGQPAGSLVQEDDGIEEVVNEVLKEMYGDDYELDNDYDELGNPVAPREMDDLSAYRNDLNALDVPSPELDPAADLAAQDAARAGMDDEVPEPNWLYDDDEMTDEDELYEKCGSETRDKLYEGRTARVGSRLIGWATK